MRTQRLLLSSLFLLCFIAAAICDSSLYIWGNHYYGIRGNGITLVRKIPHPHSASTFDGKAIVSVASGHSFTIVATSDGSVYTWGNNFNGQLGDGTTTHRATPAKIPKLQFANKAIKQVSAGDSTAYALTTDGQLFAWGENTYAEVGNGNCNEVKMPSAMSISKTISKVSAGTYFAVALATDGTVFTIGSNSAGQRGVGNLGSACSIASPSQLPATAFASKTITDVTAGSEFVMALASDGSVFIWGEGSLGQMGDGGLNYKDSPFQLTAASFGNEKITAVSAGYGHAFALAESGSAYLWGKGGYGQTGNGGTDNVLTPTKLSLSIGKMVKIFAFKETSVAVSDRGTIFAWGLNNDYRYDTTSLEKSTSPVQAAISFGGKTISQIAGGEEFTMALTSDGTLFYWGKSEYPVFGDGSKSGTDTTVTKLTSTQHFGKKNLVMVATGKNHMLALTTDGTVWAWGSNGDDEGILGLPVNDNVAVPTAIPSVYFDGKIIHIAAGPDHNLAVTDQGKVYSWGSNGQGQLGQSSQGGHSPPQIIPTSKFNGKKIIKVYANLYASAALSDDGTVFRWGANGNGQIGDGTTVLKDTPYQIPATAFDNKKVVQVSLGTTHSYARVQDGTLYRWGSNTGGELATTVSQQQFLIPVAQSTISDVTFVATGTQCTFAGKASSVSAWGLNTNGIIGVPTTTQYETEQTISTFNNQQVDIISVNTHALGLTNKGSVYAWGTNSKAELADDTTNPSGTPLLIDGAKFDGSVITSVHAGYQYSVAMSSSTIEPEPEDSKMIAAASTTSISIVAIMVALAIATLLF